MGLIANIRGLLGLQGPPGPRLPMLVAHYVKPVWVIANASSALSLNTSSGQCTVLTAGWFTVNWAQPVYRNVGDTFRLPLKTDACVYGPLA